MSKVEIVGSATVEGKFIVSHQQEPQIDFTTASVSAIIFPESRYPGGVGGLNYRILTRAGSNGGKPAYVYSDESVMWNATAAQWEMVNNYSGVINYSPEDTEYPWQVSTWYYGQGLIASDVDAVPIAAV